MGPARGVAAGAAGQSATGAQVLVAWCRLRPRDRAREVASAALLAQARRLTHRSADVVAVQSRCGWCGSGEHGQPSLVDGRGDVVGLHASTSRAGDLVVVAVSEAGPVGVDVEQVDAAAFEGFLLVVAHPEEPPLGPADSRGRTRTWVRKESVLKATGHGLRVDPRRVRVTGPEQPPVLVSWDAGDPPTSAVWMEDVHLTDAYAAAVTVLAAARPTVRVTEENQAARRSTTSR